MKGISYHKATGKWEAYVMRAGKKVYLGVYRFELEARGAVKAANRLLGIA